MKVYKSDNPACITQALALFFKIRSMKLGFLVFLIHVGCLMRLFPSLIIGTCPEITL